MTEHEFLQKLTDSRLYINGPKYLGAPEPEFDRLKINESMFSHNLRLKALSISVTGLFPGTPGKEERLLVDWVSQGWDSIKEQHKLFREVVRWATEQAKFFNYTEPFVVAIQLIDREKQHTPVQYWTTVDIKELNLEELDIDDRSFC